MIPGGYHVKNILNDGGGYFLENEVITGTYIFGFF